MFKKKNICITINSLNRGGAEKQCLLLAEALTNHHNVLLVILKNKPIYNPYLNLIREENFDHVFLSNNPFRRLYQLIKIFKKRKIEIIFSYLPTDTVSSAICGKIASVPYIFGGIRNSYISRFKNLSLKFVHNNLLNYTITNNYSAYDSSIRFGFNKNLLVMPNGIKIRPLTLKNNFNTNTINLISLGRLVEQKDYETALKSIVYLKEKLNSKFRLKYRIVGQGSDYNMLHNYINDSNLIDEVEIVTNPGNIYDLLQLSDIYLCTSIFEGISNSILEAMNCGLPIVATDAGDNSRLVVNGKNGFIVNIKDYKDIASRLIYLINSLNQRQQMGLESFHHLKRNYSFEIFQKNYLNLIENVDQLKITKGKFNAMDVNV